MKKKTKNKTSYVYFPAKVISLCLTILVSFWVLLASWTVWVLKKFFKFMKRPWYNTIDILFDILMFIESIWEWIGDRLRSILRWLQSDMKEYFIRIAYSLVDKDYIPRTAYWSTNDYINNILLKVLPYYIKDKKSYPTTYKNVEAYTKDLKEFYEVCREIDNWFESCLTLKDKPKWDIKKYQKLEKRIEYFYGKVLPKLWD